MGAAQSESKDHPNAARCLDGVETFHPPAHPPRRVTFFVSHRGPDTKELLARPLAYLLDRLGFTFFFDDGGRLAARNKLAGMRLLERNDACMAEGLYGCECGLVIISPGFHESKWCLRELATLLQRNEELLASGRPGCLVPIFYGVSISEPRYEPLRSMNAVEYKGGDIVSFLLTAVVPRLLSLDVCVSASPRACAWLSLQPPCRVVTQLQYLFQPGYGEYLRSCGLPVQPELQRSVACDGCAYHDGPFDEATRAVLERAAHQQVDEYEQFLTFYLPPHVYCGGAPGRLAEVMKCVDTLAAGCAPDDRKLSEGAKRLHEQVQPLQEALHEFLSPEQTSAHPLLLLMGEAGSGKTLASVRLLSELIGRSREGVSWEWAPVRLELKGMSYEEFRQHSLLSLLRTTAYASACEALRRRRVLFILDGFDELSGVGVDLRRGQHRPVLSHLDLARQFPCSRVIVTCRHNELSETQVSAVFGHQGRVHRRYLLPFSTSSVREYVELRSAAPNESEPAMSGPGRCLRWEDYEIHLRRAPDLRDLVRVPFVLRLFVDALPLLLEDMKAGRLSRISRYFIYQCFVRAWFGREYERMPADVRASLNLGSCERGKAMFVQLSERLAFSMYAAGTLVISTSPPRADLPALYAPAHGLDMDYPVIETKAGVGEEKQCVRQPETRREVSDAAGAVLGQKQMDTTPSRTAGAKKTQPGAQLHGPSCAEADAGLRVWLDLERVVKERCHTLHAEQLQSSLTSEVERQALLHRDPAAQAVSILRQFLKSCPLRLSGDRYSFVHKTFYEYFAVGHMLRVVWRAAGAEDVSVRRAAYEEMSNVFGQTLFHRLEPSMVRLLRDRLLQATPVGAVCEQTTSDLVARRLRRCLTEYVLCDDAVAPGSAYEVALSNILSVLNLCNVSFSGVSLRGRVLKDVNLSRAVLTGARLSACRFQRCNLQSVVLDGAVLTQCTMTDCHFGMYQVLRGHSDWVRSVCWSPDGGRVLSGSADGSVRVWDLSSGETTHHLEGHSGTVNSVCWSPDGGRVLSGSADGSVRVWDLSSGETTHHLEGHSGAVSSVCWSPDGGRVLSGSADGSVRVWDLSSGETTHHLEGHSDWVRSVCWSPDGGRVLSGSDDGSVRVWDVTFGFAVMILGRTGHPLHLSRCELTDCTVSVPVRRFLEAHGAAVGSRPP